MKDGDDDFQDRPHIWADSLRSDNAQDLDRLMSFYRPYLSNLAGQLIPEGMQVRGDRSDLVQETLILGLAQRDQFKGTSDAELASWLRTILKNVAIDWIRHHTADKRDVFRHAESSSGEGADALPTNEASPSQHSIRREEFRQIEVAMAQLLPEQRLAVQLRSEGLTFKEVGLRTNRTEEAARMLWGRGLSRLNEILGNHAQR